MNKKEIEAEFADELSKETKEEREAAILLLKKGYFICKNGLDILEE